MRSKSNFPLPCETLFMVFEDDNFIQCAVMQTCNCFFWLATNRKIIFLCKKKKDWLDAWPHTLTTKSSLFFSLSTHIYCAILSMHNYMVSNCFLFFLYCLRPYQKKNTTNFGLVTHKLKRTWLENTTRILLSLFLFILPFVPFVAKLTLQHLEMLVVEADSFMLC